MQDQHERIKLIVLYGLEQLNHYSARQQRKYVSRSDDYSSEFRYRQATIIIFLYCTGLQYAFGGNLSLRRINSIDASYQFESMRMSEVFC